MTENFSADLQKNLPATARAADRLKQFVGYSLILHFGVLLCLILRGTILAPPPKVYIPSLRVDLVALPDLKQNDLPPAPEPAKQVEAAKSEPKVEPKVDIKPVNLPPDQGDISLKKKKKELSKKEKAAQDRLKNAIARIKALERIKMMSGQQVKGNQISKGSALTGDAKTSLQTTYFDVVLERVRNYWELPKWLQDQTLSAQVTIYLDRQGKMIRYNFTRRSGNESFDNEIKRTIQAAAPFPEPPIAIIPDLSRDGILLGFPM